MHIARGNANPMSDTRAQRLTFGYTRVSDLAILRAWRLCRPVPRASVYRLSFVLFFRDGLDTGLRTRKHLKKTNLNAPVYELHGLPCADVLYVILYWKDDLILRTQQRPDDF